MRPCTPTDRRWGRLGAALLLVSGVAAEEGAWDAVAAFGRDTGEDLVGYLTAPAGWDATDWTIAGATGLAIGGALALDAEVQRSSQANRNPTRDRFMDVLEPGGSEWSFAYLGVAWGVGEAVGDVRGRHLARDGLEACLITSGVLVPAMKLTLGRRRPSTTIHDHWDVWDRHATVPPDTSFPSGHTAQAFTLAAVTARTFDDQPVVGAVAFTLAGGVAWSRINGNQHWLSDTVAGAALGTTVGWYVVGQNQDRRRNQADVAIEPVVGLDRARLLVRF